MSGIRNRIKDGKADSASSELCLLQLVTVSVSMINGLHLTLTFINSDKSTNHSTENLEVATLLALASNTTIASNKNINYYFRIHSIAFEALVLKAMKFDLPIDMIKVANDPSNSCISITKTTKQNQYSKS